MEYADIISEEAWCTVTCKTSLSGRSATRDWNIAVKSKGEASLILDRAVIKRAYVDNGTFVTRVADLKRLIAKKTEEWKNLDNYWIVNVDVVRPLSNSVVHLLVPESLMKTAEKYAYMSSDLRVEICKIVIEVMCLGSMYSHSDELITSALKRWDSVIVGRPVGRELRAYLSLTSVELKMLMSAGILKPLHEAVNEDVIKVAEQGFKTGFRKSDIALERFKENSDKRDVWNLIEMFMRDAITDISMSVLGSVGELKTVSDCYTTLVEITTEISKRGVERSSCEMAVSLLKEIIVSCGQNESDYITRQLSSVLRKSVFALKKLRGLCWDKGVWQMHLIESGISKCESMTYSSIESALECVGRIKGICGELLTIQIIAESARGNKAKQAVVNNIGCMWIADKRTVESLEMKIRGKFNQGITPDLIVEKEVMDDFRAHLKKIRVIGETGESERYPAKYSEKVNPDDDAFCIETGFRSQYIIKNQMDMQKYEERGFPDVSVGCITYGEVGCFSMIRSNEYNTTLTDLACDLVLTLDSLQKNCRSIVLQQLLNRVGGLVDSNMLDKYEKIQWITESDEKQILIREAEIFVSDMDLKCLEFENRVRAWKTRPSSYLSDYRRYVEDKETLKELYESIQQSRASRTDNELSERTLKNVISGFSRMCREYTKVFGGDEYKMKNGSLRHRVSGLLNSGVRCRLEEIRITPDVYLNLKNSFEFIDSSNDFGKGGSKIKRDAPRRVCDAMFNQLTREIDEIGQTLDYSRNYRCTRSGFVKEVSNLFLMRIGFRKLVGFGQITCVNAYGLITNICARRQSGCDQSGNHVYLLGEKVSDSETVKSLMNMNMQTCLRTLEDLSMMLVISQDGELTENLDKANFIGLEGEDRPLTILDSLPVEDCLTALYCSSTHDLKWRCESLCVRCSGVPNLSEGVLTYLENCGAQHDYISICRSKSELRIPEYCKVSPSIGHDLRSVTEGLKEETIKDRVEKAAEALKKLKEMTGDRKPKLEIYGVFTSPDELYTANNGVDHSDQFEDWDKIKEILMIHGEGTAASMCVNRIKEADEFLNSFGVCRISELSSRIGYALSKLKTGRDATGQVFMSKVEGSGDNKTIVMVNQTSRNITNRYKVIKGDTVVMEGLTDDRKVRSMINSRSVLLSALHVWRTTRRHNYKLTELTQLEMEEFKDVSYSIHLAHSALIRGKRNLSIAEYLIRMGALDEEGQVDNLPNIGTEIVKESCCTGDNCGCNFRCESLCYNIVHGSSDLIQKVMNKESEERPLCECEIKSLVCWALLKFKSLVQYSVSSPRRSLILFVANYCLSTLPGVSSANSAVNDVSQGYRYILMHSQSCLASYSDMMKKTVKRFWAYDGHFTDNHNILSWIWFCERTRKYERELQEGDWKATSSRINLPCFCTDLSPDVGGEAVVNEMYIYMNSVKGGSGGNEADKTAFFLTTEKISPWKKDVRDRLLCHCKEEGRECCLDETDHADKVALNCLLGIVVFPEVKIREELDWLNKSQLPYTAMSIRCVESVARAFEVKNRQRIVEQFEKGSGVRDTLSDMSKSTGMITAPAPDFSVEKAEKFVLAKQGAKVLTVGAVSNKRVNFKVGVEKMKSEIALLKDRFGDEMTDLLLESIKEESFSITRRATSVGGIAIGGMGDAKKGQAVYVLTRLAKRCCDRSSNQVIVRAILAKLRETVTVTSAKPRSVNLGNVKKEPGYGVIPEKLLNDLRSRARANVDKIFSDDLSGKGIDTADVKALIGSVLDGPVAEDEIEEETKITSVCRETWRGGIVRLVSSDWRLLEDGSLMHITSALVHEGIMCYERPKRSNLMYSERIIFCQLETAVRILDGRVSKAESDSISAYFRVPNSKMQFAVERGFSSGVMSGKVPFLNVLKPIGEELVGVRLTPTISSRGVKPATGILSKLKDTLGLESLTLRCRDMMKAKREVWEKMDSIRNMNKSATLEDLKRELSVIMQIEAEINTTLRSQKDSFLSMMILSVLTNPYCFDPSIPPSTVGEIPKDIFMKNFVPMFWCSISDDIEEYKECMWVVCIEFLAQKSNHGITCDLITGINIDVTGTQDLVEISSILDRDFKSVMSAFYQRCVCLMSAKVSTVTFAVRSRAYVSSIVRRSGRAMVSTCVAREINSSGDLNICTMANTLMRDSKERLCNKTALKVQYGGPRDLVVMDLNAAVMQRTFETVSRAAGASVSWNLLAHPDYKANMESYVERKMMETKSGFEPEVFTLYGSQDMAKWGPKQNGCSIGTVSSILSFRGCEGAARYALCAGNKWCNRKIEIPNGVIDWILGILVRNGIRCKDARYEERALEFFRENKMAEENVLEAVAHVCRGKKYIVAQTHMGQGLLHDGSTLFQLIFEDIVVPMISKAVIYTYGVKDTVQDRKSVFSSDDSAESVSLKVSGGSLRISRKCVIEQTKLKQRTFAGFNMCLSPKTVYCLEMLEIYSSFTISGVNEKPVLKLISSQVSSVSFDDIASAGRSVVSNVKQLYSYNGSLEDAVLVAASTVRMCCGLTGRSARRVIMTCFGSADLLGGLPSLDLVSMIMFPKTEGSNIVKLQNAVNRYKARKHSDGDIVMMVMSSFVGIAESDEELTRVINSCRRSEKSEEVKELIKVLDRTIETRESVIHETISKQNITRSPEFEGSRMMRILKTSIDGSVNTGFEQVKMFRKTTQGSYVLLDKLPEELRKSVWRIRDRGWMVGYGNVVFGDRKLGGDKLVYEYRCSLAELIDACVEYFMRNTVLVLKRSDEIMNDFGREVVEKSYNVMCSAVTEVNDNWDTGKRKETVFLQKTGVLRNSGPLVLSFILDSEMVVKMKVQGLVLSSMPGDVRTVKAMLGDRVAVMMRMWKDLTRENRMEFMRFVKLCSEQVESRKARGALVIINTSHDIGYVDSVSAWYKHNSMKGCNLELNEEDVYKLTETSYRGATKQVIRAIGSLGLTNWEGIRVLSRCMEADLTVNKELDDLGLVGEKSLMAGLSKDRGIDSIRLSALMSDCINSDRLSIKEVKESDRTLTVNEREEEGVKLRSVWSDHGWFVTEVLCDKGIIITGPKLSDRDCEDVFKALGRIGRKWNDGLALRVRSVNAESETGLGSRDGKVFLTDTGNHPYYYSIECSFIYSAVKTVACKVEEKVILNAGGITLQRTIVKDFESKVAELERRVNMSLISSSEKRGKNYICTISGMTERFQESSKTVTPSVWDLVIKFCPDKVLRMKSLMRRSTLLMPRSKTGEEEELDIEMLASFIAKTNGRKKVTESSVVVSLEKGVFRQRTSKLTVIDLCVRTLTDLAKKTLGFESSTSYPTVLAKEIFPEIYARKFRALSEENKICVMKAVLGDYGPNTEDPRKRGNAIPVRTVKIEGRSRLAIEQARARIEEEVVSLIKSVRARFETRMRKLQMRKYKLGGSEISFEREVKQRIYKKFGFNQDGIDEMYGDILRKIAKSTMSDIPSLVTWTVETHRDKSVGTWVLEMKRDEWVGTLWCKDPDNTGASFIALIMANMVTLEDVDKYYKALFGSGGRVSSLKSGESIKREITPADVFGDMAMSSGSSEIEGGSDLGTQSVISSMEDQEIAAIELLDDGESYANASDLADYESFLMAEVSYDSG